MCAVARRPRAPWRAEWVRMRSSQPNRRALRCRPPPPALAPHPVPPLAHPSAGVRTLLQAPGEPPAWGAGAVWGDGISDPATLAGGSHLCADGGPHHTCCPPPGPHPPARPAARSATSTSPTTGRSTAASAATSTVCRPFPSEFPPLPCHPPPKNHQRPQKPVPACSHSLPCHARLAAAPLKPCAPLGGGAPRTGGHGGGPMQAERPHAGGGGVHAHPCAWGPRGGTTPAGTPCPPPTPTAPAGPASSRPLPATWRRSPWCP
jgi:hypothetical protein